MAKKPFEIQSADLIIGGVNLQAGTTGVVIPGVTQATDYRVEEVNELDDVNPDTFGTDANAISVIDNAEYLYRSGTQTPSNLFSAAAYNVEELDDGAIEEISIVAELEGTFLSADKTFAEAGNMWATTVSNALDNFSAGDWIQIPFRPKFRANEVENLSGGGNGESIQNGVNSLSLDDNGNAVFQGDGSGDGVNRGLEWDYGAANGGVNSKVRQDNDGLTVRAYTEDDEEEGLYAAPVNIVTNQGVNEKWWRFAGDGGLTFPDGSLQTTAYTGESGSGTTTSELWIGAGANPAGAGILSSTNGITWTPQDYEMSDLEINRVAIGANMIVYLMRNTNSSGGAIYYTSAPETTPTMATGTDVYGEGAIVTWEEINYLGGKFVAVGSYESNGNTVSATINSIALADISRTYPRITLSNIDYDFDGDSITITGATNTELNGTFRLEYNSLDTYRTGVYDLILDDGFGNFSAPTITSTDVTGAAMNDLTDVDGSLPIFAYSTNGISWTYGNIDPDYFMFVGGPVSELEMSDVAYNGTGYLIPVLANSFGNDDSPTVAGPGAFYITDLTAVAGEAEFIPGSGPNSLQGNYNNIAAYADGTFFVCDDDYTVWTGNYTDGWTSHDIRSYFSDAYGWQLGVGENNEGDIDSAVAGTVGGTEVWAGTTNAGMVVSTSNQGSTFQFSIPDPYTDPVSISQATPLVLNFVDVRQPQLWEKITVTVANGDDTRWNGVYYAYPAGPNLFELYDDVEGNTIDGSAWTMPSNPLTVTFSYGRDLDSIHIADDVCIVYSGNSNKLYRSTDLINWTVVSNEGDYQVNDIYYSSSIVLATNQLTNGDATLTLNSDGSVRLPSGGTITEGVVTSNPTIQLTPASPSASSQKLVIKGGGNYINTENGIEVSAYLNTWAVTDSVTFYVYAQTRPNETLYWWIVPEEGGISLTPSGIVELDSGGAGSFNFTLDSDDYEFRVRVSPEQDNYDPATVGVQSVLMNPDAPTFGDYHLHLTTGNLTETSIFLGTDDHNVRTTTDGSIQITTPNDTNQVWEFTTGGTLILPGSSNGRIAEAEPGIVVFSDNGFAVLTGASTPANDYEVQFTGYIDDGTNGGFAGATLTVTAVISGAITDGMTVYGAGLPSEGWVLSFGSAVEPVGSGGIGTYVLNGANYLITSQSFNNGVAADIGPKSWVFDNQGELSFPDGTVQTTAYTNPNSAFTGYLDYGSDGSDPTKFTSVRSLKPLNAIKEIQMSPEIFGIDLNQTSVRSQLEKIVNTPRESKLTLTLASDNTKVWNYAVTHIGRSDFATDYKGYTARFIRTYSDNASGIIRMIIVKGSDGTLYQKYWDPIASNDDWYVGMYGPSTVLAFTIADSTAWIRRDYEQLVRFFESIVDNVVYNGVTEITDAEQLRTTFYANINTVISDMGGNLYYNFRAYNNSRFFSGVPLTSETSTVNAEITFDVTQAGRYQTVGITNVGAGFQVGQQITLLGSSLDAYSTTPAEQFDGIHNATVTVTAVDGSGGITEYTVSGHGVGEWGTNSINDGEDDQFDVSHKFSTNISWVNDHSDGSSIEQNNFLRYNSGFVTTGNDADDFFGSGSKYVMVSHKGVTMMAATGVSSSIEWLAITGNSGFDNDGTVDEGDVKIGTRYSLYLRCVSGPEYLPQVDQRYLMSLETTDRYGLIEVISNSYNPGSPSDNILLQSLHEGDFTVKGNDELILTANMEVTIRGGNGWIAPGGDSDGRDVLIYGGDGFANGNDTTKFGEGGEVRITGGQGGSFAYPISAMTNASPAVVTLTRPLELPSGVQAKFDGMVGLVLSNSVTYYVSQLSETQLEIYTDSDRNIPLDTSGLGSFVSGSIVLGKRDGDVDISSLGYFNGNLKLNDFVWPNNYGAVSVGQYLKVKSIEGSTPYLEFANDNTTVTKTGAVVDTGAATVLVDSTWSVGLVDGNYGPFTLGVVTFTVEVTGGVAVYTVTATTGDSTVGEVIGALNAEDLGGTPGTLSPIIVTVVNQNRTAIDLTKTTNILEEGLYTLENGVDGQIMYFVPASGNTNETYIRIANARILDGGTFVPTEQADYNWEVFVGTVVGPYTISMAIFADGAWCLRGGANA